MDPKDRKLADRVTRAAETLLAVHEYVAPVDVLLSIRWLDGSSEKRWRQGQADCLESVIQTNPLRIAEAMARLRSWAEGKGLLASETAYVARTPQRPALRFSKSGDPGIERLYRTHWVSPELSERKRERLKEKADKPPELVVIQPLNHEWACRRCGDAGGGLLIMEPPGPACLPCAGLDDLEFVPSGDALLTRRAKAHSPHFAVVVRFSKTRGRYERQGLLVEPQALAAAQGEVAERQKKAGRRRG